MLASIPRCSPALHRSYVYHVYMWISFRINFLLRIVSVVITGISISISQEGCNVPKFDRVNIWYFFNLSLSSAPLQKKEFDTTNIKKGPWIFITSWDSIPLNWGTNFNMRTLKSVEFSGRIFWPSHKSKHVTMIDPTLFDVCSPPSILPFFDVR